MQDGIVKMTIELYIFLTEFNFIKLKDKKLLNFESLKNLEKTESQKIQIIIKFLNKIVTRIELINP